MDSGVFLNWAFQWIKSEMIWSIIFHIFFDMNADHPEFRWHPDLRLLGKVLNFSEHFRWEGVQKGGVQVIKILRTVLAISTRTFLCLLPSGPLRDGIALGGASAMGGLKVIFFIVFKINIFIPLLQIHAYYLTLI